MNTHQTAVPTINCGVFLRGAKTGSPRRAFVTIELENMTNIVDNQHAKGCFLENACAFVPKSSLTAKALSKLCATSKYGYIFSLMT